MEIHPNCKPPRHRISPTGLFSLEVWYTEMDITKWSAPTRRAGTDPLRMSLVNPHHFPPLSALCHIPSFPVTSHSSL